MVIKRIHIEGYGGLKDVVIDFNEGSNMIYGPNEAGKSTLKHCILALLYGQERLKNSNNKSEYELMKPWNTSKYRASLTYTLNNGRTFTVARDFEQNKIRIIDVGTNKDFTNIYNKDEKGELTFPKEHFGVTRKNFISSSLIENDNLKKNGNGLALSDYIASLADSASTEHMYKEVIERLEKASKTIGTLDDNNTPLGKAAQKLDTLRKDNISNSKQKQLLNETKKQLNQALLEKEQSSFLKKKLSYILKNIEKQKLNYDINEIQKLDTEILKIGKDLRNIYNKDSISLTKLTELYSLNTEREKTQQYFNKIEEKYNRLKLEIENINNELEVKQSILEVCEEVLEIINLSEDSEAKNSVLQTKQKMLEQANIRERESRENFENKSKVFEEFNNYEEYEMYISNLAVNLNKQDLMKLKESEVERLNLDMKETGKNILRRFLISVLIIMIGGSIGLYGFYPGIFAGDFTYNLSPAYGIILSIGGFAIFGGVIYWISGLFLRNELKVIKRKYNKRKQEFDKLKKDVQMAQKELKKLFKKIGALSIDELRKKYREYSRIQIDLETASQMVKTLKDDINNLSRDTRKSPLLREVLINLGYTSSQKKITLEIIEQFKSDYNDAKEKQKKEKELQIKLQKNSKEIKNVKKEIVKIKVEIDRILSQAKVKSIESYEKAYRRVQEVDKLRGHSDALKEKRKIIANDRTINEMENQKHEIDISINETLNKMPEFKNLNFQEYDYKKAKTEYDFIKKRANKANTYVMLLETKIESMESSAVSKDKKEQLINARNEKNHLLRHKEAINMAISMILKTGRQFHEENLAPQLARNTGKFLNNITKKYNEIFIDKNFNIRIKSPNSVKLIDIAHFSKATIEQLYLALRLGIAKTFSRSRESLPLILDDPFTNFDEERKIQTFKTLLKMEKSHQIILFTCSSVQKKDFALVLKENNKIAKLYRIEKLEIIKPENFAKELKTPLSMKRKTGTSFLQLPEGFEIPYNRK